MVPGIQYRIAVPGNRYIYTEVYIISYDHVIWYRTSDADQQSLREDPGCVTPWCRCSHIINSSFLWTHSISNLRYNGIGLDDSGVEEKTIGRLQLPRWLCYTSWFKMNDPHVSRVGSPRRFWETYPEKLRTCFTCPCQPVTEQRLLFCFCFFSPDITRSIIWGYFDLEGIPKSRRKRKQKHNKKHPSSTGQQRLTEHVCKFQDLPLKNGMNIWALVRKTCVVASLPCHHVLVLLNNSSFAFSVYGRFWR